MSEGHRRGPAYDWRWLIPVAVVAIFAAVHYARSGSATASAPRPHLVNGGGARTNGPFRMGDEIALGSYGVTVLGLTDPFQVQPGPLTQQPPPGKRYVLLRVGLSNLGSARLPIAAVETVLLVDQQGRRYSAHLLVLGAPNPPPPKSLGAHATQRGALVFTLPDTARPVAALFEPGRNLALLTAPSQPDYGQVRIGLGSG